MWLPGPVYESLPYCYLIGGLLFIGGTFYLGPDAPGAMLYIGCGIFSIVAGAAVFLRRQAYRGAQEQMEQIDFA